MISKESKKEGVAPTVEHWIPNPRVVGSNPIVLTFFKVIINQVSLSKYKN